MCHVPKCMSCHKAIVVITGKAHCFHDYYGIGRQVFPTGLQLLLSLSNNCGWALIIDITIFKLFEQPSYDFHFYNGLEHDTRQ